MSVTINGTTGVVSPAMSLTTPLGESSGGSGVAASVVDLSSATSDYDLAVGQKAVIDYTAIHTVPLHVVAGDGRMFRLSLTGTNVYGDGTVFLLPNNTVYGNVFTIRVLYGYSASSVASAAIPNNQPQINIAYNCLSLDGLISTSTNMKYVEATSSNSSATLSFQGYRAWQWQDTTTVWSSLGTIVFSSVNPASVTGNVLRTGKIIIERVA